MATRNHNFSKFTGETLDDLRHSCYTINSFDVIEGLDYIDFFCNYLVPNCPCILSPRVTESWTSRQEWVTVDGSPDFYYLSQKFGDTVVPVADCQKEQYSSHPKEDLRLSDYLAYWQRHRQHGYPAQTRCLYLKDWHFTKAFPDYQAYETPVYFQSDWLNEFWDTLPDDDYRFVYMGPRGTWTPFHSDVYRSFSWSANICGRKKWIFYPPGCEDCLKDKFGQLIYDVTSPDLDDPAKYPRATEVKDKAIEVIQEQGQVIYVPSGWHHQVYNLEDTISINHNWLNGCNVDISWFHLVDSLEEVKREIADCRDMDGWHEQCQVILKASAGIDFRMFIDMLETITKHRIHTLEQIHTLDTQNRSEKPEYNTHNTQTDMQDENSCQTGIHNNCMCDDVTSMSTLVQEKFKDDKENVSDISVDMLKKCSMEENKDEEDSFSQEKDQRTAVCGDTVGSSSIERKGKSICTSMQEDPGSCGQTKTTISDNDRTCDCMKTKLKNMENKSETGASCKKMSQKNDYLFTKDFVLYDLMRVEEIVKLILKHEDLGMLSPDLTVRLEKMLELINP